MFEFGESGYCEFLRRPILELRVRMQGQGFRVFKLHNFRFRVQVSRPSLWLCSRVDLGL